MQMGEYSFTTLRSLREFLRHYSSLLTLTRSGDMDSATTLLDLSAAMGDDPTHRLSIITPRQKEAITLHLIQDLHVDVVADIMHIQPRVVYIIVNDGLARLLTYLQSGKVPDEWQEWQRDYIRRNAGRPRKELAAYLGRTPNAVRHLIFRLRKRGETIERSGRRSPSDRSETKREAELLLPDARTA